MQFRFHDTKRVFDGYVFDAEYSASCHTLSHFETFLNQYKGLRLSIICQDGDVKKYSGWVDSDWLYHALFCYCHRDMWRSCSRQVVWASCCLGRSVVAFCKFLLVHAYHYNQCLSFGCNLCGEVLIADV